jgi:hypothetical protein
MAVVARAAIVCYPGSASVPGALSSHLSTFEKDQQRGAVGLLDLRWSVESRNVSPICPRIGDMSEGVRRPTGHVFRVERKRGPVWYAKYRLLDGRQEQRKLGPAWTERGRPAAGNFTKRLAEDWLRDTLDEARRGTLAEPVRTGATFADAAAEWLRYVEHDRDVKPSTLSEYRSVAGRLVQEFGSLAIEEVSARRIEEWRARLGAGRDRPLSNRTRNKSLTILGGIMDGPASSWPAVQPRAQRREVARTLGRDQLRLFARPTRSRREAPRVRARS